ncbi:MAG: Rpn family recombination-promoting nuclease/putative transposase [Candidatus Aminicenantes bacterium]|nr:MAG: Rpn family recombination-promoting nuclease/putative transposase [Candidatus Aminicenantes bacterium]
MTNTTTDIYQVNDSFFHKIFDNPENARDFLNRVLPHRLKNQLDLENIEVEDTKYVSNLFKKGFSDIVVKTSLKTKKGKKPVDIYFILEHKTEGRVEIFIQVLKYMVFEWEKDYNNNKPPRIIIPVVFYHGADEWKIPRSFADQFDVDDEVKRFLLDYRYVLFDTNPWDFRDESNKELKKNVFLFTSMVLMKAAYKHDTEAILEIFKFWYDRGFLENIDIVVYFLEYVSQTQDISRDQLKKMLDDSKIDGGEIMPTLAQQMKEEFREEFMETMGPQLKEEGKKEGKEEGKKEIAKAMKKKGTGIEFISEITGLSTEEIEKL